MLSLTPFLLFDGNCAEAMVFYQSCLGGELTITKVANTPMKDQIPPDQHQKIAYARLKSGAIEFSATDWLHPKRTPKQGNTVAMYANGGDYGEPRAIFDAARGRGPRTVEGKARSRLNALKHGGRSIPAVELRKLANGTIKSLKSGTKVHTDEDARMAYELLQAWGVIPAPQSDISGQKK